MGVVEMRLSLRFMLGESDRMPTQSKGMNLTGLWS